MHLQQMQRKTLNHQLTWYPLDSNEKISVLIRSGKYAILIAKSNKQWTEIYLYQYQQDCKISVLSQR